MEKKKHILVVSQYFYPEQFRINDICMEWVRRGYEVTVITGIPNYPQGKFFADYGLTKRRKEMWNGVQIIRIPLVPRGKSYIGLACNYLSFVVSGWIWNIFTGIKADIVFNYEVSPMTQALVGVWYAKKRKIPCYLYVTDLWPDDVEIITGIHNKFIIGMISRLCNYIYTRCNRIFTSSESFLKKINERGISKDKLEFWPQYAEDFYVPYKAESIDALCDETGIRKDGRMNLIFAGNIGYSQGLQILVRVASLLKRQGEKVRFVLIGDGRYKEKLLAEIEKEGVKDYFLFMNKKPPEEIPKYLAAGDASLICLSKSEVFSMTIPAKTQSCLACGKPVLVSADGEVQEVIRKAGCGLYSAAGDAKGLYENICRMSHMTQPELTELGEKALTYYKENFEKEMLLSHMDGYLKG